MDKFTPDEKNVAMRRLMNGTKFWLLAIPAFAGAASIGGLRMPGTRAKKDEQGPQPGDIGWFSKEWTHGAEGMEVSALAQGKKNYDKYLAEGKSEPTALIEASVATMAVAFQDFWAFNIGHEIQGLTTPRGQEQLAGSRTLGPLYEKPATAKKPLKSKSTYQYKPYKAPK